MHPPKHPALATLALLALSTTLFLSNRPAALAQATRPPATATSNPAAPLAPKINPDVLKWPTMDYKDFMATHSSEEQRKKMWALFVPVERQAKFFAGTQDHWKPLKTITLGTSGPKWFSTGRLELSEVSAPGTMFHEIFHNTFNGSALHADNDNAWSEAFCDAFRYMMEKSYLPNPPTDWFKKVDGFTAMTYAQVMAKSGDKSFDQKYLYPATLIIRKAEKDPEKFHTLWLTLQKLRADKKADILDAYFAYDLHKGQPL